MSNLDTNLIDDNSDFPLPPPLRRTWKGWCSICGWLYTTVYNQHRVGGMCYECKKQYLAQWKIKRWYKKMRKNKKRKIVKEFFKDKYPNLSEKSGIFEKFIYYI